MIQARYAQQSSQSTPDVPTAALAASNIDDRPATANRTPEGKTPAPRIYGASTPESFQRAQDALERRRRLEDHAEMKRQQLTQEALQRTQHQTPCPPSPDDEIFVQREDEARRARSYSSVNSNSIASQVTSPSDMTSPISSDNLGSTDQFYPSVPSLPALISGASSVSADTEGEMLQRPGSIKHTDHGITTYSTPETLTPPSLSKRTSTETETPHVTAADDAILLSPDEDDEGYNGDGDTTFTAEDDDSDSDEGLVMSRRKPKSKAPIPDIKADLKSMERRGTNASVGSTETAKKMVLEG
jgi:[calcium/calmodulin-dependent protein kinase] kinase